MLWLPSSCWRFTRRRRPLRPSSLTGRTCRHVYRLSLWRLPLFGIRRPKDRLDDRHVGYGIFEGHGNFGAFADSFCKSIALNRVLVARGNGFLTDSSSKNILPVVYENFARAVVWRVEGNLNFDASLGAQKLHALIRNELRAASEHGMARRKLHHRRTQSVGPKLGVGFQHSADAQGLFAENPSRRGNRVTADVHEPPAAPIGYVADIFRVTVEIAEHADDRAKPPDDTCANEIPDSQPLRVSLDHEGFADFHAATVSHSEQ